MKWPLKHACAFQWTESSFSVQLLCPHRWNALLLLTIYYQTHQTVVVSAAKTTSAAGFSIIESAFWLTGTCRHMFICRIANRNGCLLEKPCDWPKSPRRLLSACFKSIRVVSGHLNFSHLRPLFISHSHISAAPVYYHINTSIDL